MFLSGDVGSGLSLFSAVSLSLSAPVSRASSSIIGQLISYLAVVWMLLYILHPNTDSSSQKVSRNLSNRHRCWEGGGSGWVFVAGVRVYRRAMRVREIGLRLLQRCGGVYVVFLSVKQPDTESDMWLSSYLMPTNSNIEARLRGRIVEYF